MKLRHQSLLITVVPIIIFAFVLILLNFTITQEQLIEHTLQDLRIMSQLASHEMVNPVYNLDVDKLNEIIDGLELDENVVQVLVLLPEGNVLTDGTDENRFYDTTPNDSFFNKAINSNDEFYVIADGLIRYSTPIMLNEKIGMLSIEYTLQSVNNQLQQYLIMIVLITMILVVVFSTLAVYLANSIVNPIQTLVKIVQTIPDRNHNPSRFKSDIPEIQKLNDKIEEMYSKLQDYQRDMIKNERLATIGEMSARITHDLRNPLSTLQNASELLKQKNPEFVRQNTKYFDFIDSAIRDINSQITDVLSHIRPQIPQKSLTKFSKILESSLSSIGMPENITVTKPEIDDEIWCDAKQMENVLSNLIKNSKEEIKDNQGQISIKLGKENGFHKITVSDTGRGISEKSLETVFEPLYTTKSTGTGLGLVNCKNIVEAHDGKVSVANSKTGGAVFTILLPKMTDKS